MSVIYEIQTAFDNNPTVDMKGAFLIIWKAFDRVWQSAFLFKLQAYGVDGELLTLLKNYLENSEQRVSLDGKVSNSRLSSGRQAKKWKKWHYFYEK